MTLRNLSNNRPSVTFNFKRAKKLDPRITFTRASFAPAADPSSGSADQVGGSYNMFNVNVPRLTDKGLLIEEARTNQITSSQDFTASPWTASDITVTNNQAIAPDGTTTAAEYLETATFGAHILYYNAAITYASNTAASSIYVKSNGRDYVGIRAIIGATGYRQFVVSLIDGSVTLSTDPPDSVDVKSAGNGWWRITSLITTVASAAPDTFQFTWMGQQGLVPH